MIITRLSRMAPGNVVPSRKKMTDDKRIPSTIMQVGYGAFQLLNIPPKLIVQGVNALQKKPSQELSITECNFLREILNFDGRVFSLNEEGNDVLRKQINKLDSTCFRKAERMLKASNYKDHPKFIKNGLSELELVSFIDDVVMNGRPKNLSDIPITFLNQAAQALLTQNSLMGSEKYTERIAIKFFRMYLMFGNPSFSKVHGLDEDIFAAIKKRMSPILDIESRERASRVNDKTDESDRYYPLDVLTFLSRIRIRN